MKRSFPILILVLLGFSQMHVHASEESPVSVLQEKARQMKLGQDPGWLKLLHVHKNIFNQTRSGVTDSGFFLSPRGYKDSDAELNATLEAFFSSAAATDDSALCRYPARRAWLDEKLNFSQDLPPYICERYEAWKNKLAPGGVSLVFASYYFNNPASMYGHTFLKLKRQGYEEGQGLLDYTVNYAAVANTNNGAAFAVRGLAGGYSGRFSTDPYYVKIQKYNNIESRDLWEYDLDLSSAEIDRLIQHLWELGPITITYFFFNKNCSYQLLPLLEVARPSLDLSSRFRFRAVPLDTLGQVLKQPGLIKKWTLRPSHVRTMLAGRADLTNPERDLAKEMALTFSSSSVQLMNTLSPQRQAKVLDSAYDFLRYKAGFFRDRPLVYQERERNLLLLRKDRPVPEKSSVDIQEDVVPPHVAHGTGQFQVWTGADRHQGFQEISIRGALHDQEADPIGYVPGSELEMLRVRARYADKTGKFNLEQLTLIDVFCLSPWDPWVHPPSWRVWGGAEVARDLNKNPADSLGYDVKGGSGFSFYLSDNKKSLWYAMWRTEAELGHVFHDGYRLGAGGQTGFILPLLPRLRLHVATDVLRFPIGNVSNVVRFYGTASYTLVKNLELRLTGERKNNYEEIRSGFTLYW